MPLHKAPPSWGGAGQGPERGASARIVILKDKCIIDSRIHKICLTVNPKITGSVSYFLKFQIWKLDLFMPKISPRLISLAVSGYV